MPCFRPVSFLRLPANAHAQHRHIVPGFPLLQTLRNQPLAHRLRMQPSSFSTLFATEKFASVTCKAS